MKMYKCSECGKPFDAVNKLMGHVTGAHRNKRRVWQCQTCGRVMAGPGPLALHNRAAHGGKQGRFYNCDNCDKVFETSSGLYRHTTAKHKPATLPEIIEPNVSEDADLDSVVPQPIELVAAVSQALWPAGLMPIAALEALFDYAEDTARFLSRVSE